MWWLQRVTHFLLKRPVQTVAFVFFVTFIPIVGMIGILIAALVTLRKGVIEGAITTVAATLPYAISFYISGQHETVIPLMVWAALGVAVLSNILTYIFAVMIRRQTSWSVLLQIAALVGVLVVSVIHLAYPTVADWWGNQLHTYYTQASTLLKASPTLSNETQWEAINEAKLYATGLMTAAILFNAILQLVVARWWQASMFSRGSLRRELQGIRLSRLAGVLFIFSLVLSYLGNGVVLDIMPIVYILFCAAGLSLTHYFLGMAKEVTTAWLWLSVIYITLLFAMPTSMVVISLLAVLDIGLDLRKRFRKI